MLQRTGSILFAFILFIQIAPSMAQEPNEEPIYKKIYDEAKKLYENKEYESAVEKFLEVRRLALEDGTYGETIDYRIGLCYEKMGNYKEAIKYYKIYVAEGSKINEKLATREDVLAKIGNLEKQLTQAPVQISQEEALNQAKQKYERAEKLLKENKFNAALPLFEEVKDIAKRANFYTHYLEYKIAVCYEGMKEYAKAIEYYKIYLQTTEIKKNWPSKASVENNIKRLQAEVDKDRKIISNVNMDEVSIVLFREAMNHYRNNQFQMARRKFEIIQSRMKENNTYAEWIEYYIGSTYEAENNIEKAIEYYKLYLNSKNEIPSIPKHVAKARIDELESRLQAQSGNVDLKKKLDQMFNQAKRLLENGKPAEARAILEERKKQAIAAKLYDHKMDHSIAVTYDREKNYKMAIKHYQIYLEAPSILPGWPDRYSVESRIQFLTDEMNTGGKTNYGLFGTQLGGSASLGPNTEDNITNNWWFWAGAAVVGIVVVYFVLNPGESGMRSNHNPPELGSSPAPAPGVTILRF